MNKLFTKIATLALGATMAVGVGVAVASNAKEPTKVEAAYGTAEILSCTAGTISNDQMSFSTTSFNIVHAKGTGSNFASYSPWRVYSNNTVTISSKNGTTKIGKVEFKHSGTNYGTISCTSPTGGSVTMATTSGGTSTWSISDANALTSVAFKNTASSQSRWTSITIYPVDSSAPTTYSVDYDANGGTGTLTDPDSPYNPSATVTVLDNTFTRTDYVFDHWNTAADDSGTDYAEGATFTISADVTLYAQWEFDGVSYAKITDLNTADKVIITTVKNSVNYYMPASTTSSAPTATSCTISNNELTGVSSAELFTVSKDSSGNFAFQNADGKYLHNNAANDGTRINSNSAAYWTVTATTNGFKMSNNSRFAGVYQTDWRSYTASDAANYKGTDGKSSGEYINFYGLTKEVAPLDTIELRDYPTSDMDIGDSQRLSYYGLDTNAEVWTGNVTYTTSDPTVATITDGNLLTAVGAGTSDITVYANAGTGGAKVESTAVTVTVLADPTRIDLPVGTYTVTIDGADETESTVPGTRDYEIIAKSGRTWYKNLTVSFTDITVDTTHGEYVSAITTGSIAVTNNSNATVSKVTVHYYKYENEGVGVYVNDSILTPTSSTGTSGVDNDLYRIYDGNVNSNTFAVKNKNSQYTSKIYSISIELKVIDEREQFHSLVVSKSASWDKTSYHTGDAPSNAGLTVTANYTIDGSTISRSQDVTSQVLDNGWTYSTNSLAKGATSFDVTATWDEHTSASFTVTGITVTDISGPIESGRYYIMNSNKTYGLNAAASSSESPVALDLSVANNEMTPFDVILTNDNEYEISVTIESTKYYLACTTTATSSANSNIRVTSSWSTARWHLDDTGVETSGAYYAYTVPGTVNRYLSYFVQNTTHDWRGYLTTGNGDPEIQFVPEGTYAEAVAEKIAESCAARGSSSYDTTKWGQASSLYSEITIAHEKNLLINGTAVKDSENIIECALDMYDYAVSVYPSIDKFIVGRQATGGLTPNGNLSFAGNSESTIAIIVIVSMVSVSAISGYFFLRKRKETN